MRYGIALLFIIISTAAFAADYEREQRWADEVEMALVVGDSVYLEAGKHKFLTVYTEADEARAAVIVVHGLGVHPNWGLIGRLRSALADNGYTTLSVQMPVLAAEAKGEDYPPTFPEAAQRLAAAAKFLRGKGYKKIAIVSHSLGSRMTDYYLVHDPAAGIDAWVTVGMPGGFADSGKLKLPVLDLYGAEDFERVQQAAAQRAAAIGKIKGGKQIKAPGADHFFNDKDDALLGYVKGFLDEAL